jgi:hypothetical protein
MRRALLILVALLFAISLFGCAGPRFIQGSTVSKGQAKFIYIGSGSEKGKQGVVKCAYGAKGELSNCREIPVQLAE